MTLSLEVVLIALGLLIGVIPLLSQTFHGLLGIWVVFIIYFLIYGGLRKRFKIINIIKADFIWLLIFVLIVFLNFSLRDSNEKSYSYFLNFFTYIILYLVDKTSISNKKLITAFYIVLLGLGIQALISIPYLLNEGSFVIRNLSKGALSQEKIEELRRNGVGTNALYTSLSAYIVFGILILKKLTNKFHKTILIISLAAMGITILMSTFLASILMLVFGLTAIALFKMRHIFSLRNIFIFILSSFGILIFVNEIVSETRYLEPVIRKIIEFNQKKSEVTGRGALAQNSWESFLSDPFIGVGIPPMNSFDVIGEHMPWVDYLAHFGIFGYLPFLFFLFFRIHSRFKRGKIFQGDNLYFLVIIMICLLANFISPMFTSAVFLVGFILMFTSENIKVRSQ